MKIIENDQYNLISIEEPSLSCLESKLPKIDNNHLLIELSDKIKNVENKINFFLKIASGLKAKNKSMVGAHFMKFCGKWDMQRIAENATQFAELLQKNYPEGANNAVCS